MYEQKKQVISFFHEKGFNIFALMSLHSLPQELISSLPIINKTDPISLGMLGSGGRHLWSKFNHPLKIEEDPIDTYSQKTMKEFENIFLLNDKNFKIYFPNNEYTLPLQKISRELNLSHQSPNGLDISKDFGLWFSFRGVFTCSDLGWEFIPKEFENPCTNCKEKTCLNQLEPRKHCPFKSDQSYGEEQILYHAKALLK